MWSFDHPGGFNGGEEGGGVNLRSLEAVAEVEGGGLEFGLLVRVEEVESGVGRKVGVEVGGNVVDVAYVGDVGDGFHIVDGGRGAVPEG